MANTKSRAQAKSRRSTAVGKVESIADLTPDPQNAKLHGERNITTLVSALREVGAARSIVIDEGGRILAGNATIQAAGEAGIRKVQVVDTDGDTIIAVRRKGLTEREKTRLALYDNRVGELDVEWNTDVLRQLQDQGIGLDGLWSGDELATLLARQDEATAGLTDPDAVPAPRATRIKPGDVYKLGEHLVMCGDAQMIGDLDKLLDGAKIDLTVSSPPYNVDIKY